MAPSRQEFDVAYAASSIASPELIIHAAAYTDIISAESSSQGALKCFVTNVVGTARLLTLFPGIPIVYINSEYALAPTSVYANTKLLGGQIVRHDSRPTIDLYAPFWSRPFPHSQACDDMFTQGDYVDVMSRIVVEIVEAWDHHTKRVIYAGTGEKSVYELARETNPDVRRCSVKDIPGIVLPSRFIPSLLDSRLETLIFPRV